MPQLGSLIAVLDYEGVNPSEFNDWYDTEHIPERLRVPGFLSAQRWLAADGRPLSIVNYDLADLDVLKSAPYRAIAGENFSPWSKRVIGSCKRFWRYEGTQILPGANEVAPEGAGGLLFYATNVEPDAEDDLNAWYDNEHVPKLLAVPGTLAARRYRTSVGEHRFIVMYWLESPAVTETAAWQATADTPWTQRVRSKMSNVFRVVCKAYRRP